LAHVRQQIAQPQRGVAVTGIEGGKKDVGHGGLSGQLEKVTHRKGAKSAKKFDFHRLRLRRGFRIRPKSGFFTHTCLPLRTLRLRGEKVFALTELTPGVRVALWFKSE
ncbi:MAG TPA: hypothetical protein VIQ22_09055, partial [Gammaproteobacteria bacterium]